MTVYLNVIAYFYFLSFLPLKAGWISLMTDGSLPTSSSTAIITD